MRKKQFTQLLYVGAKKQSTPLPNLELYDAEVGKACMAFAESPVAEPRAQFRDYILRDPKTIVTMETGKVESYLNGTLFEPQTTKQMCQGVGGHLGEGAAALMAETMLGLKGRVAHTAIRQGKMRAPDFVVVTSLKELFTGPYNLKVRPWEATIQDVRLPLPMEAKARRETVGNLKRFLLEGAVQQIISYWWAMSRSRKQQAAVGYGLVTVFCHQEDVMVHCLLRPKSAEARAEVIGFLSLDCGTPKELRELLQDDGMIAEVLNRLEGF